VVATIPTLAVSAIFCIWNAYQLCLGQRNRILHQRVAYMLWVMATGEKGD
jgi:hypothetical protein